MAGSFRIAEGYVEVSADETAYDRAMDRLKGKKNEVDVGVQLDDKDALARLDRFMRERILSVKVDLDRSALSRLRLDDLKVDVAPRMQEAALRRVHTQLDRLTAERVVNIRASVDTRVAAAEIRNLIQRRQVRIGVDVDTRVAADSLANLTRRRSMTIQADADTAAAAARLDALTRRRTVHIGVDGGGGAASVWHAVSPVLRARRGSHERTAQRPLPRLSDRPDGPGCGDRSARPRIPDHCRRHPRPRPSRTLGTRSSAGLRAGFEVGQTAASSMRQVENAQRSLAKAQQGVKDAEVNAAAARAQAARQIADAQRSLKATVSDVADANRRAAEQVAQAEQDLADAQKSARQAQLDLTQARKDAARQLQDLANQQKDVELDRREAVLRVQDAQEELNKTLADPKATQKQRAEAQLTYDEAVQHLPRKSSSSRSG